MKRILNKAQSIFRILILLLLALAPLTGFAQDYDPPKDGCDPYDGCPLDTWVVLLVIVAIIFAVRTLNKQRAASLKSVKAFQ